jgi:hypothetical protein
MAFGMRIPGAGGQLRDEAGSLPCGSKSNHEPPVPPSTLGFPVKQFNRLATNRLETWAWAFRARAAEGIAQTASSHCEVKTIRQILYDIEEAVGELQ